MSILRSIIRSMRRALLEHGGPAYLIFMMPVRIGIGLRYAMRPLRHVLPWAFRSREDTNFTYDLTPMNIADLANVVALVSGRPVAECRRYIDEALRDLPLREHIARTTARSRYRWNADPVPRFARRLGWYAMARSLKPRLVVETGVDKGLGAVLLCSALLRNREEGYPGEYRGTDINPAAGYLLGGRYAEIGRILYGDSIESLRTLAGPIDLFINDSDHSVEYEAREYEVVYDKLGECAVLLSDNAHESAALREFSERYGRHFVFFKEEPLGHWFPGAGIGFSFRHRPAPIVISLTEATSEG